jgi:spermidine synthase
LFTGSGFSALIFEVVWVRLASLALGVTVYAVSTVVAAFMAGISLGSVVMGRWCEKRGAADLRLYSWLELGVAASGLLVTGLLRALPSAVESHALPWSNQPLERAAAVFVLLLVPCILMGGTLPVLTAALRMDPGSDVLGRLYGFNTLGAALGAVLTDFLLIPTMGVTATVLLAGAIDALASAGAWAVAGAGRALPAPPLAEVVDHPPRRIWPLLGIYGLCGFASVGLQVVWTRLLMMYVPSRIYSFSTMLAIFLLGLALGSLLARRWGGSQGWGPGPVLAGLLSALTVATLTSLLLLPTLDRVLEQAPGTLPATVFDLSCRAGVLFGLPTLLMGAIFPVAGRLMVELWPGTSHPIGYLYGANTIGCILGSLAAGFLLLPTWGTQRSLQVLALLQLGAAAWLTIRYARTRPAVYALGLASIASLLFLGLPGDWVFRTVNLPAYLQAFNMTPESIKFFAEDLYGTVAVGEEANHRNRDLFVNRFCMMATGLQGSRYAQLMAHVPGILQEEVHHALVICFGCGMTTGAAGLHRDWNVDCVELSSSVLKAGQFFATANHDVLHRPNVHFHLDDGRNFLLRSAQPYDVITFEPPPPTYAGVVNLYSADYYRLCARHLTPHGVVCQWLPVDLLTEPECRMIIRTFQSVFPECMVWQGSSADYLLLGSPSLFKIDKANVSRLFDDPDIGPTLRQIGVDDPATLLAGFMHGPEWLAQYGAGAPIVTDDRPLLEYSWQEGNNYYHYADAFYQHEPASLMPYLSGFSPTETAAIGTHMGTLDLLMVYRRLQSSMHDPVTNRLMHFLLARDIMRQMPDNVYVRDELGLAPEALAAAQQDAVTGASVDVLRYGALLVLNGQPDDARKTLAGLSANHDPLACLLTGSIASTPAEARHWFDTGLAAMSDPQARSVAQQTLIYLRRDEKK